MIVVQNPLKIVNFVIKQTEEKPTYRDAITGCNKDKWIAEMYEELKSIQQNQTWWLVALSSGHKAIGIRWVVTCKHDAKGNFTKYNVCLLANGYSHKFGFDYDETYASVIQIKHVHILFPLAAFFSLLVIHLDAKNPFFYGDSDFAIYIHQPPGFENQAHINTILLLLKSLYSLKQVPQIWYPVLYDTIIDLGFISSKFDPWLFLLPEYTPCYLRRWYSQI